MQDLKKELRIEEYKQLKSEISVRTADINSNIRFAVAGTALVFSWMGINGDNDALFIGWFVPIFFPIIGYIRDRGLYSQILKIADYLRQIETEVFGEEKSWERFVEKTRNPTMDRGKYKRNWGVLAYNVAWLSLLLLDLAVIGFVHIVN